jgi:hypothetical protein
MGKERVMLNSILILRLLGLALLCLLAIPGRPSLSGEP